MRSCVHLICLSIVVGSVTGHKFYQKKIPNGERVPHPCKVDQIWEGVGHRLEGGGGYVNPFGYDFAKNGHIWDDTLCKKDSDNDGITNGVELGDPECRWKEGDPNPSNADISHPGVCNPWNSVQCEETNQWLKCGESEFKCEALNNPDITVKNFTLQLKRTNVPATETTYMCQVFDVPDVTQNYHIIADQVIVNNSDVLHHILVYGCSSNQKLNDKYYDPFVCGMGAGRTCEQLIGLWTVGLHGTCHNPSAGFLIGKDGYRTIAIELHWNNPQRKSDYYDSSGMIIHYTPNLRPHNAGVFMIGQHFLHLPPKKDRIVHEAVCPKECLSTYMTGSVYLTNGINHMHYLGKSQYVKQYRNDTFLSQLTREPVYSYDSPQLVTYNPVKELESIDEIRTTCEYKTSSKNKTTFFGYQTSDEMCLVFFWYYPKENLTLRNCVSYGTVPYCRLYGRYAQQNPVVQGCNYQTFQLKMLHYGKLLSENCKPFLCLDECIPVVQELRKDPCLQGDILQFITENLIKNDEGFYIVTLFHSCDVEIAELELTTPAPLPSVKPCTN